MKLALCGPVSIDRLLPWLPIESGASLPPGRGGTAVTQIAIGLLAAGHDLHVVTLDHRVREPVRMVGEQLTLSVGPYRTSGRARDAFRVERTFVREALGRVAAEIVHAHWTYEYALGALSSGLPLVVTVRDWAPTILRYHRDPYRTVRLLMNYVVLARSRHLTATSPYIQRRIEGWSRDPVALVPNAVEDAVFMRRSRGPDVEHAELLAVNVGFGSRKNVGTLLEAFALVRRRHPAWHLRLVGPSYEPGGNAETWARQRGQVDGVTFHGPVLHDDLPGLLRQADLFVHPAREESFGNVLIEAMAQGLPVIGGTASGAVPWVLDGGRAGALTDVTSAESLAGTCSAVLEDPDRWWELAEAGYERAQRCFRTSSVVEMYEVVYRAVLAGEAVAR